jgi:hypothetical protein
VPALVEAPALPDAEEPALPAACMPPSSLALQAITKIKVKPEKIDEGRINLISPPR